MTLCGAVEILAEQKIRNRMASVRLRGVTAF